MRRPILRAGSPQRRFLSDSQKKCMSTQLSENTVKVKRSELREHCRDLLEVPEPRNRAPKPRSNDLGEDAGRRERRA